MARRPSLPGQLLADGGFLPTTAFALVAAYGDMFAGLWYPVVIAAIALVIGFFFLPETKDRPLDDHGF